MKVKDIQKGVSQIQSNVIADGKKSSPRSGFEFQRQMTNLNQVDYEAYIQDLAERIGKQGEAVTKKADLSELQKYRELIAQLLNETTSNSFAFCKMDKFDARGRHKVYAVVKRINQKLDELTSEVLREQTDNIRLLSIVDDIRGMLVDLLL